MYTLRRCQKVRVSNQCICRFSEVLPAVEQLGPLSGKPIAAPDTLYVEYRSYLRPEDTFIVIIIYFVHKKCPMSQHTYEGYDFGSLFYSPYRPTPSYIYMSMNKASKM